VEDNQEKKTLFQGIVNDLSKIRVSSNRKINILISIIWLIIFCFVAYYTMFRVTNNQKQVKKDNSEQSEILR
jgi:flagellar basal body-associated protein FliL